MAFFLWGTLGIVSLSELSGAALEAAVIFILDSSHFLLSFAPRWIGGHIIVNGERRYSTYLYPPSHPAWMRGGRP